VNVINSAHWREHVEQELDPMNVWEPRLDPNPLDTSAGTGQFGD
jgi:hypothetical protein